MSHEVLKTLMGMAADDLKRLQALPLDKKIELAKANIQEWYEHWDGKVAVSFSGGKDSTVLLHLVRSIYPDVPAVFIDTGLEFPDIKRHIKSFDNVVTVRPRMNFKQVLTEYGYPIISKEVAQTIERAYTATPEKGGYALEKLGVIPKNKLRSDRYCYPKYSHLLYVDFKITSKCCNIMKKDTAHAYERETNRKFFVGTMAEESMLRMNSWIRYGCNVYSQKRSISKPISVWTNNDVLEYTKKNDLQLAKPYGEIVNGGCQYATTGCSRTGCVFCGFGAHLDKGQRFKELVKLEPRLYEYCLGGGEYNDDGIWIPTTKGLGFAHVYDTLNRIYGNHFVEYEVQQTLF